MFPRPVRKSRSSAKLAFVGSRNGIVYALDARIRLHRLGVRGGSRRSLDADRRAGRDHGNRRRRRVYFGDANAQVYALDIATGKLRWKMKVDTHPDAMVTGRRGLHQRPRLRPRLVDRGRHRRHPHVRVLHVPRQRQRARRRDRQSDLEDVHDSRQPQTTTKNSGGDAAVGTVRRRRVVDARARRRSQPDVHRRRATTTRVRRRRRAMRSWRSRWTPASVLWTTQATAGDAWNTGCLEAADSRGRSHCPSAPGPDHDFASAPVLATARADDACCSPDRSPGCCTASNPDTGDVSLEDAGRRRRRAGRNRVGICRRRRARLRLAVERAREEARRGRRYRGRQRRRRHDQVADAAVRRHVPRRARVQHRPAGCRQRHTRHGVLGESRRPPSRIRSRNGAGDLRHRHGAGLRHGEQREGEAADR